MMGLLRCRRVRRDKVLVDRFRRGIRAGFVTVAIIAVSIVVLTEVTSSAVLRGIEQHELAIVQRVELTQLRADLPRLIVETDPAESAAMRIDLGSLMDEIAERQVLLTIDDPGLAAMTIENRSREMLLSEALERTLDAAAQVMERSARGANQSTLGSLFDEVTRFSTAIEPLMAELADERLAAVEDRAAALRRIGRIMATVTLLAALLRLVVLGRPLVDRLEKDQVQFEETSRAHELEGRRRHLTARLAEGMETAETEPAVYDIVERALGRLVPENPAELLLADSSMAHLRVEARNRNERTPGCGVKSPWSCPAVRRANTLVYEDSEGIKACPYLATRDGERCSAVCVPVSFMGDAMGVLHVTGPVNEVPVVTRREGLELIAGHAAVRLGAIRSFAKAQTQASTDALTGLPNRRATEEHVGLFLASRDRGSVAIADLDHFKLLNDNHGHEAGDRALRMFADLIREVVREEDWVGRWGGEEFVLLLPGLSATEASAVLDRVRIALHEKNERTDLPDVTVSIGVVDNTAASTLDELVNMADDCLYVAKESGRDQVVIGPVSLDPGTGDGLAPAASEVSA